MLKYSTPSISFADPEAFLTQIPRVRSNWIVIKDLNGVKFNVNQYSVDPSESRTREIFLWHTIYSIIELSNMKFIFKSMCLSYSCSISGFVQYKPVLHCVTTVFCITLLTERWCDVAVRLSPSQCRLSLRVSKVTDSYPCIPYSSRSDTRKGGHTHFRPD